ncbi:hypothetical protein DL764_004233 [Monosporascus ibericus]|uniref:Uncharacterized protein n=1 Tax=Monosporascus ibericus TaxID=155417 RepID=A0A4Q4TGX3_9PEZI|nr:hypothetical protein DL764_004233 [Monosporascus ibericus]
MILCQYLYLTVLGLPGILGGPVVLGGDESTYTQGSCVTKYRSKSAGPVPRYTKTHSITLTMRRWSTFIPTTTDGKGAQESERCPKAIYCHIGVEVGAKAGRPKGWSLRSTVTTTSTNTHASTGTEVPVRASATVTESTTETFTTTATATNEVTSTVMDTKTLAAVPTAKAYAGS